MDNNYKYLWNMGLAFDENRILKKMSNLAREGWILKEMTLFKYKLEKAEPQELIYSMDYKELKGDEDEYFELFSESKWKHMCSYGSFHFFSASPGTVPIYTDKENYLEKYKHARELYFRALIVSTISILAVILIKLFVADKLNNKAVYILLFVIATISVAIAAPCLAVTLAYNIRLKG